ncbi:MAG: hypothetical protein MUO24_01630 [Desulfobacterales bacterium]|nr:hypothetical protein [Desulfobacterales bacterium]
MKFARTAAHVAPSAAKDTTQTARIGVDSCHRSRYRTYLRNNGILDPIPLFCRTFTIRISSWLWAWVHYSTC